MHQENSKVLSIVIPVFNEINFLNKLFDQIETYFNRQNIEIIVVDDGSTDGSSNLLNELKKKNHYKFLFKLIKLDVNYGPGGETQFLKPIDAPGGKAPPPSEINMTLSFTETEIMTKEKIAEGF